MPVSAKVVKPLQLTTVRDLDFGTVVMGTLTANETVSVTAAGRTCGTSGQLTCSGIFATAQFRVVGTNNQPILVSSASPTVTLANGSGGQLVLTPVLPTGTLTLPNSGNQGAVIQVGGRLAITPTTPDGLYTGIIDIQVAYQ